MEIEYIFRFSKGRIEQFNLQFDDEDLSLQSGLGEVSEEPWMVLSNHQCKGCSLDQQTSPLCPVAANLGGMIRPFKEEISHTEVEVEVLFRERKISKCCDLQQGIRSMMGLVMATSGCPLLDKLRPMAYLHQPFSTMDETLFRSVSSYLMAQFLHPSDNQQHNFDLEGVRQLFNDITLTNESFALRIQSIGGRDANINALLGLDIAVKIGGMSVDSDWLEKVKPLFSGFIRREVQAP
ncbi:MAG: hypothetical protein HN382_12620 [Gammaproteobacteria bacterium]|jgi:hypothetical protein|nr:hypothetical protein [Gammaproteobacteria bacterium]MBT4605703.1 hypothetical protein [Thiotrichales bacterium]MBT3473969.1 hypothetical protein [Gammaproteobacteria bacterium]MBT3966320.1 hypothetical protein [Gammaproteobacteria bacterium]MBT4081854.1 hypothetical protein [Gammaproteobacteria bacterium]